MRTTHDTQKKSKNLAPLLLPVLALLVIAVFEWTGRGGFVSHEVTFTDSSASGLAIMPASCASRPAYHHTALPLTSDSLGYVTQSGQTEYGADKNSVSVCVTNTSGSSYFIPAKTAVEMLAFKDAMKIGLWGGAGVGADNSSTVTDQKNGNYATGFGSGGGGGGWYGGSGGGGLFGGGGGGAGGYTAVQGGGRGGGGVVVISYTSPSSVSRALVSGTSWTVPTGVTSIKVWVVGGGGGGAGTSAGVDGSAGGGGGAGGVAYKTYSVSSGQTVTYALGSHGAGGSGAANGSAGGATTFTAGGVTITATGGAGGNYNSSTNAAGGTGSGGDGASTGGTGKGKAGDSGGGGGGGIGGAAGGDSGASGGVGGTGVDISGLQAAVAAADTSTNITVY